MEIKAKCKFDLDSIKALTHVSTYKKSNPKKTVLARAIFCSVLLLAATVQLALFGFRSILILLIALDLLIVAIDAFMYWGLPRIQYKAFVKLKDAENDYIFTNDVLKVTTKGEIYSGEAEIGYSLFTRVYETSKYFFLFQANNQAFLIDKSTIEGGSAEDIREKLSSYVGSKYTLCKY